MVMSVMTKQIRDILTAHAGLPVSVDSLADDADLYQAGLRSFSSVQLMLAIEDAFDIEFPETALNRKTFQSIAAIQDVVSTLTRQKSAA
jgi:acyl carrier protein